VAASAAVILAGVVGGLIVAVTRSTPSVCSPTAVADKVLPSVVTISVTRGNAKASGSGEVIRDDGYILTNNHVIALGADGGSLEVTFNDGVTAPATIKGRDPLADLAVIKVNDQKSLSVIPFGSTDNVRVGQQVVALGAPLGLTSTVTTGIVSALGRTVDVPGENGRSALLLGAIQTDAAINPGNSGGALTNCSGDMVGVPTAGAAPPSANGQPSPGSVGLGFAIPVDFAKKVADEIIATGKVTHSYLGIQVAQLPPTAVRQGGTSGGLYVVALAPGGPAAAAGLRPNDIITKIDGDAATNTNQLTALALTKRPGDTVKVTYERDGRAVDTTVTLGARPT
jgi:putative serine protease PepD